MGGANGKLCSGHGRCKGSGTRKGNGDCQCDTGFSGDTCDQCAIGFFQDSNSESELKCKACHKSCLDKCTGSGPTQCLACKKGYLMNLEKGCVDLDECNDSGSQDSLCKINEFCVNTEGSFSCVTCDKACASCDADGPDSCIDCADGFVKNDDVCVSKEVAESANETEPEESESEKPPSAAAVDVHEINDELSTQDPVEDDALRTEL